MIKFKKGDRVVVVELYKEDRVRGIQIGDAGVVLENNYGFPFVRMDKFNKKLGTAGGRCEDGYGFSFSQHQLELEEK